ncbi:hypothetical protein [Castellaniella sp.]|uniref:hypothetical protein n=1 Tax=Castellaniella sp. TaxID=1955812 RepID=UPI002AFE8205|nr:hypothetical protein [Castellaniella sp.]
MTDRIPPIPMQWDGEAMRPVSPYWAREADKAYVIGESYPLLVEHERSTATHNHQFAWIGKAWATLPEEYRGQPWAETSDKLRKHALIACGYNQTSIIDVGSNASALRVRDALCSAEARYHGYAIGTVRGRVVQIWTPESQSPRTMGAKRFQESKQAILEWIADKLSVPPADLQCMGEAA